jgi:GxxExxY protein
VDENQISKVVVDAAIEVHRTLGGPGLLESVYEEALACELRMRGLRVARQVSVPVCYKGVSLRVRLRIDMLVNEMVIIECKATPKYDQVFESQALTYLRLRDLRLAIVINFGERLVKSGIHRVVNRIADA